MDWNFRMRGYLCAHQYDDRLLSKGITALRIPAEKAKIQSGAKSQACIQAGGCC